MHTLLAHKKMLIIILCHISYIMSLKLLKYTRQKNNKEKVKNLEKVKQYHTLAFIIICNMENRFNDIQR